MNNHNKPKQGIGLNYLIEFLQFLQLEHRACQLYRGSPYDFKSATIKLIKFCISRDLISKREEFGRTNSSRSKRLKNPRVYYKITDDGRTLLRMIS